MPKGSRPKEQDDQAKEKRKADSQALGARLRAARKMADETLDSVAIKMTAAGIPVGKAAVGHWETGHSVPDALQIKKLAKMYGTSADALLWDTSLSPEAMQFAAEFDGLTEAQRRTLRAIWVAFIQSGNPAAGLLAAPVTEHQRPG